MAISQETGPQARTHSSCRSSAARWARCWPKPVPPEEPVMKFDAPAGRNPIDRSEEHTSELQSLMRISYAVFCLKKKKHKTKVKKHKHVIKIEHQTPKLTTTPIHIRSSHQS